jgi:oligopeptide/dipeptide ABC transporter ATP-binding protein
VALDGNDAESGQTATVAADRRVEDPILSVEDLRVTFGMERGQSRVLDDVTIDVGRGESLAVVGESGSGKSMFADALLDAVVEPGETSGEVTFHPEDGDAVDVLDLPDDELKRVRWEHLSMVSQGAQSAFNPSRRVRTHFEETLAAHGADHDDGMARARELLADVYLEPERVLDSYAHELSGGMKQRTLIALSLLLEPEVLILDEPTAALDLLMQRSIIRLLDDLKDKYDLTLVFITHDLPLVADLADRVAVLYAFEFVEVGPRLDVLRDAQHPYTRALLNATPNLDVPLSAMAPIEGASPDPVNVPAGCSYHERCPLADATCRERDPALDASTDGRRVACHHWQRAREEIPLAAEAMHDE